MTLKTHTSERCTRTVYGRRISAGEVLLATDLYDSTTGDWSAAPCPGAALGEGPDAIWVRPLRLEFYPVEDPESRWLTKFMGFGFSQHALPTTVSITETSIVTPMMARQYNTGLFLLDGMIVEYETVRDRPGFNGTVNEVYVSMVEVFEDTGRRPHHCNEMVGWRLCAGPTQREDHFIKDGEWDRVHELRYGSPKDDNEA